MRRNKVPLNSGSTGAGPPSQTCTRGPCLAPLPPCRHALPRLLLTLRGARDARNCGGEGVSLRRDADADVRGGWRSARCA
eukprot:357736-Rhodomonas_salina.1